MNSFSFVWECLYFSIIYGTTFLESILDWQLYRFIILQNVFCSSLFWALLRNLQQPNVGSLLELPSFFSCLYSSFFNAQLLEISLWCVSNMVFLHWDHLYFLCIMDFFISSSFLKFWKFSAFISLNNLSAPFFPLFYFWDTIILMSSFLKGQITPHKDSLIFKCCLRLFLYLYHFQISVFGLTNSLFPLLGLLYFQWFLSALLALIYWVVTTNIIF